MEDDRLTGVVIVTGCVLAILEATFVLVIICTDRIMSRSSYHLLIGNLLVADLVVSVMGLCFRGPGLIDPTFSDNNALSYVCYVVPFVTWMGLYASSLSVLCITCHRMVAITDPLKFKAKVTKKTSLKMILATWLAALFCFVVSLTMFYTGIGGIVAKNNTTCYFWTNKAGGLLIQITDSIYFAVPLLVIVVMYCMILRVMVSVTSSTARTHSVTLRVKVFRNISLLLFFFTVSWLPNYIMSFRDLLAKRLRLIKNDTDWNLYFEDHVVVIFFYSNLVLDPLIYGFGSKNFRSRIIQLYRRARNRNITIFGHQVMGRLAPQVPLNNTVTTAPVPGSTTTALYNGGVCTENVAGPCTVNVPEQTRSTVCNGVVTVQEAGEGTATGHVTTVEEAGEGTGNVTVAEM